MCITWSHDHEKRDFSSRQQSVTLYSSHVWPRWTLRWGTPCLSVAESNWWAPNPFIQRCCQESTTNSVSFIFWQVRRCWWKDEVGTNHGLLTCNLWPKFSPNDCRLAHQTTFVNPRWSLPWCLLTSPGMRVLLYISRCTATSRGPVSKLLHRLLFLY